MHCYHCNKKESEHYTKEKIEPKNIKPKKHHKQLNINTETLLKKGRNGDKLRIQHRHIQK